MAYAFIHGEVKGSGASVEFKGNGLDLLDLTIQIVGSVVAEVPEPIRPYIIHAFHLFSDLIHPGGALGSGRFQRCGPSRCPAAD